MHDVTFEQLDSLRLAAIRHVGPYTGVGNAFQRISAWAAPHGLLGPGLLSVGIYHDDPRSTPEAELRSDACVGVPASIEADPAAGVAIVEVPAGEYAVLTHVGPYEGLPAVYDWFIGQWLPSSGREAAHRPCLEVYPNSPYDTPPEKLVTRIHLPLR